MTDELGNKSLECGVQNRFEKIRQRQLERINNNEEELFWGVKFKTDNEKILLDTLLGGDKDKVLEFYKKVQLLINNQKGSSVKNTEELHSNNLRQKVINELFGMNTIMTGEEKNTLMKIIHNLRFEINKNQLIQEKLASENSQRGNTLDKNGNSATSVIPEKLSEEEIENVNRAVDVLHQKLSLAIIEKITQEEMSIGDLNRFISSSGYNRIKFVREFQKNNYDWLSKLSNNEKKELFIRLDELVIKEIREIIKKREIS